MDLGPAWAMLQDLISRDSKYNIEHLGSWPALQGLVHQQLCFWALAMLPSSQHETSASFLTCSF